jgi:hypothetical protein
MSASVQLVSTIRHKELMEKPLFSADFGVFIDFDRDGSV